MLREVHPTVLRPLTLAELAVKKVPGTFIARRNACRFAPTCSVYAIEALARHGAGAGTALTIGRIARCHPWCAGGLDPVPAAPARFFTSLLQRSDERDVLASPDIPDSTSP